jgi:hypothetical protein
MDGSFGPVHPDTDRSWAEARGRQLPQIIIVGLRPWSREKRSLCHFDPSLRLASSAAVLKADARGGAAHFILESNT